MGIDRERQVPIGKGPHNSSNTHTIGPGSPGSSTSSDYVAGLGTTYHVQYVVPGDTSVWEIVEDGRSNPKFSI